MNPSQWRRSRAAGWLAAMLGCAAGAPFPAAAGESRVAGDYLVQSWETVDGLPENSATAIVQSPDGYLWAGTFDGLARFNGDSFTVFDPANAQSRPRSGIVNLHLDRRGWMWASTYNGLFSGHGETWRRWAPPDGWTTDDWVRTFSERPNGDLFLTTFNGQCFEFSGGRFTELPAPPGQSGFGYHGSVDEEGRWWVAQNKFIGRLENSRWVPVMTPPEVSREEVSCAAARGGGLWILVGRELLRMRRGVEVSRLSLSELPGAVWSMSDDSHGNVWIASLDKGFSRVAPDGTMTRLDSTMGVSDRGRCVLEGREGSLWLGTSGDGLIRLRSRRFRQFEIQKGRKGPVVQSVSPDGDGMLAATFGDGLFRIGARGVEKVTLPAAALGTGYLQCVLRDRAGRLWIGTYGNELWLVENDHARPFPREKTGGGSIVTLFEDSRGYIWVSSSLAAAVFDGGDIRMVGPPDGLEMGGIRCFAEDAGGAIWAATGEAVFRRERDQRFVEVRSPSGEPIRTIQCLAADAGGGMWLGSSGRGLLRWKEGSLTTVDRRAGFPVDGIAGIIADGDGHFWMTSGRSLVRAAIADLHKAADGGRQRLVCQVFDASDGLPHAEFTGNRQPTCVRDARGQLWFASTKGVVMTDPASLTLNAVPPPVHVIGISFDTPESTAMGRARTRSHAGETETMILPPYHGLISLPPGSRHITIRYEALSLAAPEKVRFQYRLEGVDAGWRDAGTERAMEFFELPAATYTFRVRAANNDGIWNESGDSIVFAIQPRFWETWWFRVGGAALLLGSGGAMAWWRSRVRHRRQLAELERVQQQQAELAHLSRVATMGHFASALAHEINQPLSAILRNTEAATLFLQNPNPDLEEIRAIVTDIQRDDQRAGAVIDRMRALLKRRNIEARSLDVPALVADTVSLAQSDARSRRVRLMVELAPDLPPLSGDRVHLQQVLLNLLINAVDATRDAPDGQRDVVIRAAYDRARFVEVSVCDTGHGIPPDRLPRVFEPFFTSKDDGMGVGLAISRTIIEAHGGRIWAENNADGQGSTFRFTVPGAGGKFAGVMSATPIVHLVDDDESFLKATSRLLRASGFEVKTFASAADYLAGLEHGRPGCVVVDLYMPGMSGLELQAAMARKGIGHPVIFLTGCGDIPSTVRAMRDGAEDFMEKRAPKAKLLDAIRRALARNRQERAEQARRTEIQDHLALLTDREREVLGQVVQGKMNKEIAAELSIHERTVKLHRTAITTKLGIHSVADLTKLWLAAEG